MDAAKLIEEKLAELSKVHDTAGIDSVLRHLAASERHLDGGRLLGDPDRFTDVIYRTNQVFEGILKELFEVLTGKPANKKTPSQIEKHFETGAIFNDRLMHYFRNYRQDWRNASTHDHRLDFNEQEAFLAISTVSAFCYMALDQMLRHLAAVKVKTGLKSRRAFHGDRSTKNVASLLVDQLPQIIPSFVDQELTSSLSSVALLGAIGGLLTSEYPEAEVAVETLIHTDVGLFRPDILLKSKSGTAILELKIASADLVIPMASSREARLQLKAYAEAALADEAIVVLVPSESKVALQARWMAVSNEEDGTRYTIVYPGEL